MADVKWIKIVTNIFDDEKIRYIETLPNGDETIVIWFKILCLAGKSNSSGLLMMTDRIAYTDQMLSSIFNRDIKSIQMALGVFESLDMIEMMDNRIYLTNWEKHQSLEKLEVKKLYDREYQKSRREGKLLNNRTTIVRQSYDRNTTIVRQEYDNRALDIDKELDKEIDIKTKDMGAKPSRFTPPTLDEVASYIKENNYQVDPDKWIDFYSSKGWMVGKNKMKDWKACVRTWTKNSARPTNSRQRVEVVSDFSNDGKADLTQEEMEAIKRSFKQMK